MADQPLDPQTEERVRRLLAEARHDEPMPADVASRLDGVLADLAAEPAARGKVVRLADRRRRAGALLVAAAAVVVAGIGIGQALTGSLGDSGGSPTSAEGAPAPASAAVGGAHGRRNSPDAPTTRPQRRAAGLPQATRGAFPIRPGHFSFDVRSAKRAPHEVSDGVATDSSTLDGYLAQAKRDGGCRARDWGAGRYVPVSYGGLPGYLVFRKPAGDTQVADLFLCGSRTAVRSTTLPRP